MNEVTSESESLSMLDQLLRLQQEMKQQDGKVKDLEAQLNDAMIQLQDLRSNQA